jgi:hypothetical protein
VGGTEDRGTEEEEESGKSFFFLSSLLLLLFFASLSLSLFRGVSARAR